MKQTSELIKILNGSFHWNKARVTLFAQMLLGLLTTRTVNLAKIACAMTSHAEQSSRYRRLKRFFSGFVIDFDQMADFIFSLFFTRGNPLYLSIDRTNWKWGKSNINILTLAITFKGIAIPIYWELLNKRGNSSTQERIHLLQKFINRFGKASIAGLLADREFVGEDWFAWLIQEKISFYIRVKKNFVTTNSRGREVPIAQLFRGLRPTEQRMLYRKRDVLGQQVYVVGLKLCDGHLLIIVTNEIANDAIKLYARRWEIETLFSCLKGRGFNFEQTHLVDAVRIKKMMILLAIAFCWAHKTGEWSHEQQPIKLKKHGRPAVSLFRYGLDYLVDILTSWALRKGLLSQSLVKTMRFSARLLV